jgi:anti-sigma B factor antagonist
MITSHTGGQLGMLSVVRDGAHTLVLSGELDIASARELEAATLRLAATGARAITLDLRRLEFMDLAGLRVILEVHERSEEQGYELRLIPGPAQVQRLFDHTGLLKVLPFAPVQPTHAVPAS